jgi:hypothetical protein
VQLQLHHMDMDMDMDMDMVVHSFCWLNLYRKEHTALLRHMNSKRKSQICSPSIEL